MREPDLRDADPGVERWRRLEAVLDALLDDGEAAARERRLAALAAEDPALADEARSLLDAAIARGDDLLDHPAGRSLSALLERLAEGAIGSEPPREIDRYRLLEVLGRGGMGVVYLAERSDRAFEKRVALKLIPHGLETPEKERRFRLERQILARLEHPGIARLLDGGVTADGYPYLVLERIEGEPIDRHCERRRLPLRARIELFLEVCAAVQYAHGNLVVHRDLKPGNILVDTEGRVKLLDFGIAKILNEDEGGAPPTRLPAWTPDYASPEQRAQRPVSTASDVWSLGALLYRLLTGWTPAQLVRASATGPSDPSPGASRPLVLPSRAMRPAPRPTDTALSSPPYGARALEGDLDRIVAKALEEEPGRRYVSAAALADDLRRHLDGLPVVARPWTRRYRLARFVARHRAGALVAAAAALLAAAGVAGIAWQARIAAAERDRARVEAARAERVVELVAGIFAAASPSSAGAGRASLPEILDTGEARLRVELDSDPAVRGKLLDVLGGAHSALGDSPRAIALARESVADLRRAEPADGAALASALVTLAAVSTERGTLDAVGPALDEAHALLLARGLGESRAMARLLHERGVLLARTGDERGAEVAHREALGLWRRLGAEAEAAVELAALAGRMDALGRPEEGLELKRQALDALRGIHGDDHPSVLATRNNIAYSLHARGRLAEAEEIYRDVLLRSEALLGAGHPSLADSLGNLGKVLLDQGRLVEAAPLVRRAAEVRRAHFDADHFARITAEMNLASLELGLGRTAAAIALYESGLERFERRTGAGSQPTARCRSLLGIALQRAGDPSAALPLLRAALEVQRGGARPLDLADTLAGLGAALGDLGRADEALSALDEAIALRRGGLPAGHRSIAEAESMRVRTLGAAR